MNKRWKGILKESAFMFLGSFVTTGVLLLIMYFMAK